MDDFVRKKLSEWGLWAWMKTFRDQGIDEESFYCLDDQDIDNLITEDGPKAKFKQKLKLLKEHEKTTNAAQVSPLSNKTGKGKRVLEHQGGTSIPTKKLRPDITSQEKCMLSEAKKIMACVYEKLLYGDTTMLNAFLKKKICDLKMERREMVGVFGRTGAGKSSLINAVIGEKDLLSSGDLSACTTVIIKVEANKENHKYEAEIEFITKEEWELKQILLYLTTFFEDTSDHEGEDADDYDDAVEMLSAVYGEDWRSYETNLMDKLHFREIPEFLNSKKKTLTCETAKELSAKLVKYTRCGSKDEEIKRWFWPLVKCVTIRVPDNDLLQHITLVDLPGNGDRNKSRDSMWKEVVGNCSTVWIVTDINRSVSEKESWEILKRASSIMGNGGQCQQIHFICTKADKITKTKNCSADGVRAYICKRNMQAKEEVRREFRKLKEVKKYFSDECFKVFTVSSTEFQEKQWLEPADTEVPELQEFLQNLNDCHSETLNYVSGAYGILSLIQGANCREVADKKAEVCTDLEKNLKSGLKKVSESMLKTIDAFEVCLIEAVEEAKSSCESALKSFLKPEGVTGSGFHQTLKCVVKNNGVFKTRKGENHNLNETLASCLSENIDEEFMKIFPNESKSEPFRGAIGSFSLHAEALVEKYRDVQLQLEFLRTEEVKMKTKLNKTIRERKKEIYSSLMTTVEENMKACYKDAQQCEGKGLLKNMRNIIEQHVRAKKDGMFEKAKDEMLSKLRDLRVDILNTLEDIILEAIELSLRTDDDSLPDVKKELETVTKYYNELKKNTDQERSPTRAHQPGQSVAQVC
ncbi:nuclear GTPase SLIP-GC-like isoform X2 [Cheilinus undulatus]|uniref:nuclear GTPase SLIP-GC-like isoform X2 n=1 Tax=Cheilinus undulatus TaxID=241271 RepID=UPI001BD1F7FB|nr:nuclear GTPase SLIP-GC-like isoform X2 [Cheilinus undulatus]